MARAIDKDYLLIHKRKVRFFGIGLDDESWGYAVPVEVIESALTLTPPNEWVSVEGKMPEEEHLVLAYSKMFGMAVAMLYSGSWYGYNGEEGDYCSPYFYVTHWMPLPAPPDRRPPEGEEDT